jgi:hypothetical protein
MERRQSGSSLSTIDGLPTERNDPVFNHLRNVDAMSHSAGDLEALHQANADRSNEEAYVNREAHAGGEKYDLEAQSVELSTMGKALTRADTAAWVTKHPSRIPDDGIHPPLPLRFAAVAYFSDEEEGGNVYSGVRGS